MVNDFFVILFRIKLRDGRYLVYKIRGVMKEKVKYKVILSYGFCVLKDIYIFLLDVRILKFLYFVIVICVMFEIVYFCFIEFIFEIEN